ncbi:unnamed protein product [Prunus armeniaca]|uniref:Uncharacterized protein n=1 Tax=Prunus armeniaca TaxID=36596 RepID=A0A6J5W696_PRUAR|nr:unnamed protein product [Prunus armeniaca]CAB4296023.1 unnamed protein product [Prunus armeniaca]
MAESSRWNKVTSRVLSFSSMSSRRSLLSLSVSQPPPPPRLSPLNITQVSFSHLSVFYPFDPLAPLTLSHPKLLSLSTPSQLTLFLISSQYQTWVCGN